MGHVAVARYMDNSQTLHHVSARHKEEIESSTHQLPLSQSNPQAIGIMQHGEFASLGLLLRSHGESRPMKLECMIDGIEIIDLEPELCLSSRCLFLRRYH